MASLPGAIPGAFWINAAPLIVSCSKATVESATQDAVKAAVSNIQNTPKGCRLGA